MVDVSFSGYRRYFWLRYFGLLAGVLFLQGCIEEIRGGLVQVASSDYKEAKASRLQPKFSKLDQKRSRIEIRLAKVASGIELPTDMKLIPGTKHEFLTLSKEGGAYRVNVLTGKIRPVFKIDVTVASEQGLLGAAFDPNFEKNRRFYLHYTVEADGQDISRIERWVWPQKSSPKSTHIIMDVAQPYPNHNAGDMTFGPDGYLYIGFGDGGWMDDPHNHGQNLKSLLGKILRIDVRADKPGYKIPDDNPFTTKTGARREIFAYGIRNPWKIVFDRGGRLIVADVGQNRQEEISLATKGANLGWKIMEGDLCFEPKKKCPKQGLVQPLITYGRDDGTSLTGGYVWSEKSNKRLYGKYIFADFVSGRISAADLTSDRPQMHALGEWPIRIATFGQDDEGRIYAAGFSSGKIYRLE